jgi:hypothetical protein
MGQQSTIEEAARRFGVSPTEIIRRIRRGELQARRIRTAQGVRLVVDLPEDAPLPLEVAASPLRDTTVTSPGEMNALRQTIALLREQLYQKEAELEARRGEMQQLLEGHQQEVQQLHVLLLQQAQGRVLPPPEQPPLSQLPTGPADTEATAPEEATDAAPPASTPASADALSAPDPTVLIGEVLGILTASAATKYEPITLQQLARAASLDVATVWRYCEKFDDYLVTSDSTGHAPAGPIWAPVNAALLRTIHMLHEAGVTTEAIARVLDIAQRDKPDMAPLLGEPVDRPGESNANSEQALSAHHLLSVGRPWWQRLLRM